MEGEKHKAICCVCHKDCEVPFKPKNPNTVMCGACYKNSQAGIPKPSTREQQNKIMKECIDDIRAFNPRDGNGDAYFGISEEQALISTMFIQRCRAEVR